MKKFPFKAILLTILALVVVTALVFGVIALIKNWNVPKVDDAIALEAAKESVKSELKTDPTFCSDEEFIVSNKGQVWTVSGWVETTSATGKVNHRNFSVRLTYNPEGFFIADSPNFF